MDYESQQQRISLLLDSVSECGSNELGENISECSDVDENEIINNPVIDSDSEESIYEEEQAIAVTGQSIGPTIPQTSHSSHGNNSII